MKQEVNIEERVTGKFDGKKLGVAGGLWCHNGDPYSHIREYKMWKNALKKSALEFHAVEIIKAVIGEKKEDNLDKHHRPWEKGDNLARYCIFNMLTGRL